MKWLFGPNPLAVTARAVAVASLGALAEALGGPFAAVLHALAAALSIQSGS